MKWRVAYDRMLLMYGNTKSAEISESYQTALGGAKSYSPAISFLSLENSGKCHDARSTNKGSTPS